MVTKLINCLTGGAGRESSMFRWRDRYYFGPQRWLETVLRDTCYERDPEGIKKKEEVADQAPARQRRRLWDKYRANAKKSHSSSVGSDIVTVAQV